MKKKELERQIGELRAELIELKKLLHKHETHHTPFTERVITYIPEHTKGGYAYRTYPSVQVNDTNSHIVLSHINPPNEQSL